MHQRCQLSCAAYRQDEVRCRHRQGVYMQGIPSSRSEADLLGGSWSSAAARQVPALLQVLPELHVHSCNRLPHRTLYHRTHTHHAHGWIGFGGSDRFLCFFSQARTDPAFKVGESPVGLQVFCNSVTSIPSGNVGASSSAGISSTRDPRASDDTHLKEAAAELPTHASIVSARDGYKPEATLFVDEDWAALRSAREGNIGKLMWRPVVRYAIPHSLEPPRPTPLGSTSNHYSTLTLLLYALLSADSARRTTIT